ncbi:deoxycytidylate deaminase [Laspinema olomoucense]|uniref:deoxycytidylate deaminase n=1 Tax=Laspinema olomoucense TaxID=3231600 RepID=UPI0021BB1AC2|nr:dCMP deaminase family protein [Laspinema sp. D3c]MCT7992382.1 dCMP deaminase family protein [Laspinema sp. D3c]
MIRPSWDEYFLMLAKFVSMRSTCLAFPVGAVIVKNKQVLATGYNGSPSGTAHCTEQGFCYPELKSCTESKVLPSRAVHAEANAIAQAAKHGIATEGSSIYVTLEPCLNGIKLIISAGITEIYYEKSSNKTEDSVRQSLYDLVTVKQISITPEIKEIVRTIL